MIMHIKKEFRFEASHQLPNHDGKCARLHGHSWVLSVWISGHVNENSEHPKGGMVMDFTDVKSIIQPIIDKLDHHHLGEGYVTCFKGLDPDKRELVLSDVDDIPPGFIPTSENLLIWIAGQLPADLNWQCLALSETCTSEARLYANDWAIQKHIDAAAKELANDNCPF